MLTDCVDLNASDDLDFCRSFTKGSLMADSSRRGLEKSRSALCPDTLCPDENKTLGLASLGSPVEIIKSSFIHINVILNQYDKRRLAPHWLPMHGHKITPTFLKISYFVFHRNMTCRFNMKLNGLALLGLLSKTVCVTWPKPCAGITLPLGAFIWSWTLWRWKFF